MLHLNEKVSRGEAGMPCFHLVVRETCARYGTPSQTEDMFWAMQMDHYSLAPSPLSVVVTKREKTEQTA